MKQLIILLGLTFCYSYTTAQGPTIQASDFRPAVGENFDFKITNHQIEGDAGENVTWDFSGLVTQMSFTTDIVGPSSSFPSATYGLQQEGSNSYYDFGGNDMLFLGNEAVSGGTSQVMTFDNPMLSLRFPLQYNDNFQDNYSATSVTTIQNGNEIAVSRVGQVNGIVDGYGTLTTPYATYPNVLRVKITDEFTDTYGPEYGNMSYNGEITTYVWVVAGVHNSLLQIGSGVVNGQPNASAYYIEVDAPDLDDDDDDDGHSGIYKNDLNSLNIYPNPTQNKLTVSSTDQIVDITVWDNNGKVIKVSQSENILDVSQLNPGFYFVTIQTHKGISTKKFIKE